MRGLLAACALCWGIAGCGDDAATMAVAPPAPQTSPPMAAESAVPPPPAAAPKLQDAPVSRALSYRAAAAPEALAAALGEPLPGLGRSLRNAAAQPLALDFAGGARVVLEPRAELWVLDFAPSLLLLRGRVRVQRAPEAARPDQPPLRIGTLGGALGITSAVELWLRAEPRPEARSARPQALTQLTLLQGGVSWQHEGADHALAHARISTGAALPALPALQLIAGSSSADAERRAARAFRGLRPWGPPDDLDARLTLRLSELSALREQSQGLLAPAVLRRLRSQAPALDAGATEPAARGFQRELVQRAQQKLAAKQLVLLAAEQSLLARLYACGTRPAGECPELRAWAERFATPLRAAL